MPRLGGDAQFEMALYFSNYWLFYLETFQARSHLPELIGNLLKSHNITWKLIPQKDHNNSK